MANPFRIAAPARVGGATAFAARRRTYYLPCGGRACDPMLHPHFQGTEPPGIPGRFTFVVVDLVSVRRRWRCRVGRSDLPRGSRRPQGQTNPVRTFRTGDCLASDGPARSDLAGPREGTARRPGHPDASLREPSSAVTVRAWGGPLTVQPVAPPVAPRPDQLLGQAYQYGP